MKTKRKFLVPISFLGKTEIRKQKVCAEKIVLLQNGKFLSWSEKR